MKHDISFLHTAEIHIATFSKLMDDHAPNLLVRHDVNSTLLDQAQTKGIHPALESKIRAAMQSAASTGAKVVVCTCSTIGGIAEQAATKNQFGSMRIDRAMADKAVKLGQNILIVAALQSTLEPTQNLLNSSAKRAGLSPSIDLLLINDAWHFFENNEHTLYLQTIAKALKNLQKQYDVIVLAQASMAGVIAYCQDVTMPIISSPKIGVLSAIKAYNNIAANS